MKREDFMRKWGQQGLDSGEMERKYRMHLREQEELQLLYEAAMRLSSSTPPGAVGGGDGFAVLNMLFDDIGNAPVGDPYSVDDWNTLFNMPANGTPFTSVLVSENLVTLSGTSGCTLEDSIFDSDTSILEFVDTGVFAQMGSGCFLDATALTTVVLQTVDGINDDSFNGCTSLVSASAPVATDIQDNGFLDCASLTTLNLPLVNDIDDNCFQNCTSLVTINFPLVEEVGGAAFQDCTALVSVTMPAVTYITSSFFGCTALESVSMPVLDEADGNAFQGCSVLTSIDTPLLRITGSNCFADCIGLTSIELPLLEDAGVGCFADCTGIVNVDLPAATIIGPFCFGGCSALEEALLPAVVTIGANAFENCTSLVTIDLSSVAPDLGPTAGDDTIFDGITGNTITITVPAAVETNNGGGLDGDLDYLDSNNTLTILNP
jgi:hypothetical protein